MAGKGKTIYSPREGGVVFLKGKEDPHPSIQSRGMKGITADHPLDTIRTSGTSHNTQGNHQITAKGKGRMIFKEGRQDPHMIDEARRATQDKDIIPPSKDHHHAPTIRRIGDAITQIGCKGTHFVKGTAHPLRGDLIRDSLRSKEPLGKTTAPTVEGRYTATQTAVCSAGGKGKLKDSGSSPRRYPRIDTNSNHDGNTGNPKEEGLLLAGSTGHRKEIKGEVHQNVKEDLFPLRPGLGGHWRERQGTGSFAITAEIPASSSSPMAWVGAPDAVRGSGTAADPQHRG